MPTSKQQRERPRRGSIYIAVSGVAMILSLIGLTAMHLSRLELRTTSNRQDQNGARYQAISATELALAQTDRYADWRTRYAHGVENVMTPNYGFGPLYFTYFDHVDGNLGNNSTDPVEVQGIGRVGRATFVYSVTFDASVTINEQVGPLEIVKYDAGDSANHNVDSSVYSGQYFVPSLPAEAITWSVTSIDVYLMAHGAPNGTLNVKFSHSDAGGLPGTLIETVSFTEPQLPSSSYAWHPVTFSNATGLAPGTGFCLTLEGSGSGNAAVVPYNTGVTQTNSHKLKALSSSWNAPETDFSILYRVYGVYITAVGSGEFTVTPGSWRTTAAP